jgi:methyltransferase family protein
VCIGRTRDRRCTCRPFRGVDPVICARLEDAGLPPASVAAAGMYDVLEHVEDEINALRQVHRLLCPGGRLFLTVPAYRWLFSADDTMAGHFRRYKIRSLGHAAVGGGFRMEYATYMFWPLPPAILLLRTLPSLVGLRQGTDPERMSSEHAPKGPAAWLIGSYTRRRASGERFQWVAAVWTSRSRSDEKFRLLAARRAQMLSRIPQHPGSRW